MAAANRPTKARRAAAAPSETRLGELLQDDGTLTEQDIKDILAAQLEGGDRFGETASRLGLADERDVRQALARQAEYSLLNYGESALSPKIVSAYQPYSRRAEELRTARSELALRWFGRGNRVLAVLEARSGQGCDLLAANLAVTFAQLGERTLLIDANLRAPAQHDLFGLTGNRGLVDFLKGRETLDRASTAVPGFRCLSIMCAGALPPNPQELLGHFSFGYLLESASIKFDVIIAVAPPVLECADAQLIAARARGAVLAATRHRTRLADAVRVRALLEPAGAALLGAVIDG